MAHLVAPRKHSNHGEDCGEDRHAGLSFCVEVCTELCYIVASLMFVSGTVFFWPGLELPALAPILPTDATGRPSPLILGCRLFDVGSIMFAVLSVHVSRQLSRKYREMRAVKIRRGTKGNGQIVKVLSSMREVRDAFEHCSSIATPGPDVMRSILGKKAKVIADKTAGHHMSDDTVLCQFFRGGVWRVGVGSLQMVQQEQQDGSGRCLDQRVRVPLSALVNTGKAGLTVAMNEQRLYLVGSFVFMFGTLIWDPEFKYYLSVVPMTPEGWVITADVLFMLGSLIFACAAYLNALGINRAHEGPFANFKVLRKYALMTTTCFAFGAFTFIAGTMCFIPAKYIATPTVADHGTCTVSMAAMEKLGCCFYGVGSLLYLLGACISFARALVEHKMEVEHEERAALIQQHVKEFVEKKHRKKVSEFADTSYKKRVDRLPDSIKDMAKHCVLRQRCKLQEMAEAEECAELAPLFWGQAEDDMMSAAESLEDEKDIFGTIKLILWGTPEGVEAECDRLQERGFWTLAWSGVRERVYGRPRQAVDVRPWLPSKGALAEPLTGSR